MAEIGVAGAEAELLREQALMAARPIDGAVASGRPHNVAPATKILNETLDRFKALGEGARATTDYFEGDEWLNSVARGCFPGQPG